MDLDELREKFIGNLYVAAGTTVPDNLKGLNVSSIEVISHSSSVLQS